MCLISNDCQCLFIGCIDTHSLQSFNSNSYPTPLSLVNLILKNKKVLAYQICKTLSHSYLSVCSFAQQLREFQIIRVDFSVFVLRILQAECIQLS